MSELLKINVNDHTEKKNGLTYLSWAWAWAEVLKIDPVATWRLSGDHYPCHFFQDGSAMVTVEVTIKGHAKSCVLPVMNNRNQAIKNPDAFAVNTAIMRCLTKAISMHGLGLYIYAGEDLPEHAGAPPSVEAPPKPASAPTQPVPVKVYADRIKTGIAAKDAVGAAAALASQPQEFLEAVWALLSTEQQDALTAAWPAEETA